MRNNVDLIISAVAKSIQNDLLPALNGEAAIAAGRLDLALLHLVLSQETTLPGIYDGAVGQIVALMKRAEPLLAAVGRNVSTASDVAGKGVPGHRQAQDVFQRRQRSLASACEALTAALADEPEERDAIEAWLEDAAAAELNMVREYLASLKPIPAEEQAGDATVATRESIQHYLSDRFADSGGMEVTEVRGAGFSMSKQILFVTTREQSGMTHDWVLRQEKPINFMGGDCTRIAAEYPLMECAHSLGLPVPKPLWLETGAALGPAFMFMKKLPGKQLGEPFIPFEPLTEDMIMQIGGMLATLHGQGLAPFEPFFRASDQLAVLDMDLRQATVHRIEQWEACFRTDRRHPIPSKEWLFSWLKKNVPAAGQPPVLVHGDFNIHNMLQVDGRVTALLDWEWGHSGNAAEDLINIRPHVETFSDWDRFLQHYRSCGGPEVEISERVENYNRCLTNMIYAASATRMSWHVGAGDLHDLASVFGSNIYGFEFQNIALSAALQSTRHGNADVK